MLAWKGHDEHIDENPIERLLQEEQRTDKHMQTSIVKSEVTALVSQDDSEIVLLANIAQTAQIITTIEFVATLFLSFGKRISISGLHSSIKARIALRSWRDPIQSENQVRMTISTSDFSANSFIS